MQPRLGNRLVAGYTSTSGNFQAGRSGRPVGNEHCPGCRMSRPAPPFRGTGSFIPSHLTDAERDAVFKATEAAICALGIEFRLHKHRSHPHSRGSTSARSEWSNRRPDSDVAHARRRISAPSGGNEICATRIRWRPRSHHVNRCGILRDVPGAARGDPVG